MSSVETGQMSAVETGQMTAAETSVLSQQNASVLSQQCPRLLLAAAGCHGPEVVKKRRVFVYLSPLFRSRGAKVSVTKYRFLQQLLAPKLRAITPGRLHRSLEKPSEPLSASTVWGMIQSRESL